MASSSPVRRIRASFLLAAAATELLLGRLDARAATLFSAAPSLEQLTDLSDQVVRGTVVAADVGERDIAGGRLTVTTYTVEIAERLKGSGPKRYRFQQVGAPGGGPRDLGSLVGLPTYTVGTEYLFLLLPAGRHGLTSPAGGRRGAIEIHEDSVQTDAAPSAPTIPFAPADPARSYQSVRQNILDRVRATQGAVR